MQINPTITSQIANEHAREREHLALAARCQTREELKNELGALARVLGNHYAAREAPGGLLELSPHTGRVGFAQHEVWDTVQRTIESLSRDDVMDASSAVDGIARQLHSLETEEGELGLGSQGGDDAELPW